jgi:hypothetical protein
LSAVAYACRGYYSYLLKVEHLFRNMPSQSPHPDTTTVVRNVGSLANRQNQQMRGPSGKSQLLPAKRRVSVPACERDSSQGGSFVPSTIEGQNSTPLIFAEQFSRCRYHSTRDFQPVLYTATVTNYANRHAGYQQS